MKLTKKKIKELITQGYAIGVPNCDEEPIKVGDNLKWVWHVKIDYIYYHSYVKNSLMVSDSKITVPISFKILWEDVRGILSSLVVLDQSNICIYAGGQGEL